MRCRSSQTGYVVAALACLALAWCGAVHAAIHASIERLSTPTMTLHHVELTLDHGAKGQLQLHVTASDVRMPTLGWQRVDLQLTGIVTRDARKRWHFDGSIALDHAPGGLLAHGRLQLDVDTGANNIAVAVTQGATAIHAALPLDQPTHARIELRDLPLGWLQGLLARAWSGKLTGGKLTGVVALDLDDNGVRASGNVAVADAGFDSAGGSVAGQGLSLDGTLTFDTTGKNPAIDTDLDLHGGQILLGSLYMQLPDHAAHLAVQAEVQPYGISLGSLRFTDPGAVQLVGSMVLGMDGALRNLHFRHFDITLPTAYQRYGKSWLATLGYADLATRGRISGSVWLDAHGLRAFDMTADHVDIRSARVAVTGLDGALDWSRDATRPATTLAWQHLAFHDIVLGGASGHWRTRDGALTLTRALAIPVLGGQLYLNQLQWNPGADSDQHLQMAFALTDVNVARLSSAFGWPQFSGTLAGSVPGLRYDGDRIELAGGLTMHVFGGFVDVTQLSLHNPFGAAPVLAATVDMRQLNLESMTGVFDFGRITGRLDGYIHGLRMVAWKPVAFDASFHTTGDGGRISQRAVNNLTAVGGGGVAAGLQGAILKLFDSFGYSRIGLSCVLTGSVCRMSGLKPVNDGYLIVEGRGLPHLSVVGHQHKVSWPTVVSRLGAAIHSGGPVVK